MSDEQRSTQTAISCCGRLTGITVVLWVLLAYPAWLLAKTDGLEGLSYAAVLCLIPGWLVFLVGSRYRHPQTQAVLVVLGGMALRMLFVLVGTLVLKAFRPHFGLREFFIWLLVFYMATLLTETLMVLKQQAASDGQPQNNGA